MTRSADAPSPVKHGGGSPLLEPVTIGGLELRNRIVLTGHTDHLNVRGYPTPDGIEYLSRRARGGVGLIITGDTPVHETAVAYGHVPVGQMNSPEALSAFRQLARGVHEHEAAILAQLNHCGGQAANDFVSERPAWAPSEMRGLLSNHVAHAMSIAEIEELVEAFGSAAAKFRRAGFDGVELHGGSGYLVQQFHSPLTNRRTDAYGGSLENRTRFAREIIARIRACTDPDFVIGYRHTVTEMVRGGYDADEGVAIAKILAGSGALAFVSVVSGSHESYQHHIPSNFVGPGVPAQKARLVKEAIDIPVIAAGRVQDPSIGEQLLRSGGADLVGMARALIADPDLPRKLARAHERREIRPCVALNYCVARVHAIAPIRCAVNPDAGRELVSNPDATHVTGRSMLVIGGGPAGLEAALTANELGARVRLVEQRDRLGGAVLDATRFASKSEWSRLVDHYRYRLEASSVDVVTGKTVSDPAELAGYDLVVLATGSVWQASLGGDRALGSSPDPGALLGATMWPADELGAVGSGTVVLVESGPDDFVAATLLAQLASERRKVVAVTANREFGEGMDVPSVHALREICEAWPVPRYGQSRIAEIRGSTVVVQNRAMRRSFEIEDVRLILGGVRRSHVPGALAGSIDGKRVLTIGDASAPRGLAQAIREGRRVVEALARREPMRS